MSAIQQALTKLYTSVGKLEHAMTGFDSFVNLSSSGAQADMFSANHRGANGLNNAAVAKRLDLAIERVEAMLREG